MFGIRIKSYYEQHGVLWLRPYVDPRPPAKTEPVDPDYEAFRERVMLAIDNNVLGT